MTRPGVGRDACFLLKLVVLLQGIPAVVQEEQCSMATQGGNSQGADCVFPFLFESSVVTSCTNMSHTSLWCATTDNYDRDSKWGHCIYDCEPPQCPYLTTSGGRCVFPFIYKGSPYYDCINEPGGTTYPWCSMTDNYDRDKRRSDCIIMSSRNNRPCIFPYQYQGETYYHCTTTTGPPWCGLTVFVQDVSATWGYCDETFGCDISCTGENCNNSSPSAPPMSTTTTANTDCTGDGCATEPPRPAEEKESLPIIAIIVPIVIVIIVVIIIVAGLLWYRHRKEEDDIPSFYYESQSANMKPVENLEVIQNIRSESLYESINGKPASMDHAYVNETYSPN